MIESESLYPTLEPVPCADIAGDRVANACGAFFQTNKLVPCNHQALFFIFMHAGLNAVTATSRRPYRRVVGRFPALPA
jgi:hypothetical protein